VRGELGLLRVRIGGPWDGVCGVGGEGARGLGGVVALGCGDMGSRGAGAVLEARSLEGREESVMVRS